MFLLSVILKPTRVFTNLVQAAANTGKTNSAKNAVSIFGAIIKFTDLALVIVIGMMVNTILTLSQLVFYY